MSSRRAARRTALFLLYQWDLTRQPLASLYEGEIDPFALELAHGVVEQAGELDRRITEAAIGWTADRFGTLERNVLRLALYELDRGEVPVEVAIDGVLAEIREKGVTDAELDRAKRIYLAEYIYESDSQSTLARRYGWALISGRTVADVEAWPDRIAKVTAEDIKKAAEAHLDIRSSVTGRLLPVAPGGAGGTEPPRERPTRS